MRIEPEGGRSEYGRLVSVTSSTWPIAASAAAVSAGVPGSLIRTVAAFPGSGWGVQGGAVPDWLRPVQRALYGPWSQDLHGVGVERWDVPGWPTWVQRPGSGGSGTVSPFGSVVGSGCGG